MNRIAGIAQIINLMDSNRFHERYGDLVSIKTMGDLFLFCYTPKCVYSKAWDPVTRICRGLLLQKTPSGFKLEALPFPKFFNVNESEETKVENLPKEPFSVTEKIDGSLLISYWFDNKPYVLTKGSFTSEQAGRGNAIISQLANKLACLPKHITFLFELVYPENPSVIKYDTEELFLLSAFDMYAQTEYSHAQIKEWACYLGLRTPQVIQGESINGLIESSKKMGPEKEGFVLRYANGLRVKIKSHEYVKLARVLQGFSDKKIMEAMMANTYDDLYNVLPEDLKRLSENIKQDTLEHAQHLQETCVFHFQQAPKTDRKSFANYVMTCVPPERTSILFQMYDHKEIDWLAKSLEIKLKEKTIER